MSNFQIYPDELGKQADQFRTYEERLSAYKSEIQSVRNSAFFSGYAYQNVNASLDLITAETEALAGSMEQLYSAGKIIAEKYRSYEDKIIIRIKKETGTEKLSGTGGEGRGSGGGSMDGCSKETDKGGSRVDEKADMFDVFAKWAKYIENGKKMRDGEKPGNEIDITAGFVSWLCKLAKLSQEDDEEAFFVDWVEFINGGLKLDGKIVKYIEKWVYEKPSSFGDQMSIFTNGLGLVSSVFQNYYDSEGFNCRFIQNADGIVSSISDFAMEFVYRSRGLEGFDTFMDKYQTDTSTVAPYEALIDMALYAVGKGIDLNEKGASWDDMADLYEGIGMTGLNQLLSSFTLGMVDIDVENSLNNFEQAENYAKDLINSWDIPFEGKVASAIVASVPVALWAIGKSLFDFGTDIGDKIALGLWG